jgi:glc operon protein GlcG
MLALTLAQEYINKALSIATENDQNIAVAIVDDHGELISYAKMDQTAFAAGVLAQSKAYTAARERQPSGNLGAWAKDTGKDMGYWTDSKITGIAGGLPIIIDGKVVGGIGISGLAESDDEKIAKSVL